MHYDREKALAKGKRRRLSSTYFAAHSLQWVSSCSSQASASVSATIPFGKGRAGGGRHPKAMRGVSHESLGTPVVEYSVDGKTYTSTLSVATSSMHPGNRITVYYQKGNPQEVRYLDSTTGWW